MIDHRAIDVIEGRARWAAEAADALAWLRGLPDGCCALAFTSPPYEAQRTYGIGCKLRGQAWVDWLRPIVVECCRVSAGLAVFNMSAPVRNHRYVPAVEWLVADLTRLDGLVCGPSPYAWVKSEGRDDADGNGTPGSGSKRYQRRDWEPLYAFCRPDRLPLEWSDNTAFGRPPKYGAGGEPSHRRADGTRVNDPWKTAGRGGSGCGGRRPDGSKQRGPGPSRRNGGEMKAVRRRKLAHLPDGSNRAVAGVWVPPAVSNPGNVIRCPVGGGKLGHPLAHDGEAPMALGVAERFVCWFAPPRSVVLDPFLGSGSTIHAALIHDRRGVGCDVRQSQVGLTRRRLSTVTPCLPGLG